MVKRIDMKKLNTFVVDTSSGHIIDKNDVILHNEKNVDSGERLLIIGQDEKQHAAITFKVDENGNVSDFKVLSIVDSHDGLTLMKE